MIKMVKIPRILIEHDYYRNLSGRAKVLYGILSEKKQESVKRGWVDDQGILYVVFPKRLMQEELCCSRYRLDLVTKELVATDLIELAYGIGSNLERRIYVHNFNEECPWIRVRYGSAGEDPAGAEKTEKEPETAGIERPKGKAEEESDGCHPDQEEPADPAREPGGEDPVKLLKYLMESAKEDPEPEGISWEALLSTLALAIE